MKIQRLLINLCSTDLSSSKSFYTSLFSFNVQFDSDWFVNLVCEESGLELGIILAAHEVVPEGVGSMASGMYLTFVVDEVDALYAKAEQLGYEVMQVPAATSYGQKRMLLVAPEGTTCDVSSPI